MRSVSAIKVPFVFSGSFCAYPSIFTFATPGVAREGAITTLFDGVYI